MSGRTEDHAAFRAQPFYPAKPTVTGRFPDVHLHNVVGLVRLTTRPRSFPCANS